MTGLRSPCVSVLMPTLNGEEYIERAICSVLGQTFADLELIVVDDGSTDRTPQILNSFDDPRIRVITNEANSGVAPSLNIAAAAARGRYVARLDSDDIAAPTRLARQVAALQADPDLRLLGSQTWTISGGRCSRAPSEGFDDGRVLDWLLHISNPIGASTTIFPSEVLQRIGSFVDESLVVSEDFDFYHKVRLLGPMRVLADKLVFYRKHETSLTAPRYQDRLINCTAEVLERAHRRLLGGADTARLSRLVAAGLMVSEPLGQPDDLADLGTGLVRLLDAYIAAYQPNSGQRAEIERRAAAAWWRAVQLSLRVGGPHSAVRPIERFEPWRPHRLVLTAAVKAVPGRSLAKAAVQLARRQLQPAPFEAAPVNYHTDVFVPRAPAAAAIPTLYVVVDTEAEFDWSKPFDRAATNVSAIRHVGRAQALFDRFGVRPIYVVDYAVATQPGGYQPLREILDRDGCAIGAHLHPWINPPFEETLSERNSFPGNLPPELEEAKIGALVDAIRRSFAIDPLFFKAGRFGVGPNTFRIIDRLGFAVDLSILPGADYRARGGPEMLGFRPVPYRIEGTDLLSYPVTRAPHGAAASLPRPLRRALLSQFSKALYLPGAMAHARLFNMSSLSPEEETASEQLRLVRSQIKRAQRDFFLVFHSPSLCPGNTPYVRNELELNGFLARLESVLSYFFEEAGGVPGNPADLLPPRLRSRLHPHPVPEVLAV